MAAGLKEEAQRIRELAHRVEQEARHAAGGDPARRIAELEKKLGDLHRSVEALRKHVGNSKEAAKKAAAKPAAKCEACAKSKSGRCEKCAAAKPKGGKDA